MILQTKIIDESKQGTAINVDTSSHELTGRKVYIESYGCQMNFSDTEIVASILIKNGFTFTSDIYLAEIIFINTCSIREKAEQTIRNRLQTFHTLKKKKPQLIIGILGCMAERLKTKLLEEEKLIDLVAGPDSYRDLPNLLKEVESGQKAVNVLLSREETYADISPIRLHSNGVSAFVSIMRGCDNMCSFCVVPFTRGRERSRSPESIINEIKELVQKGYKEVTLLGQNVDSYLWSDDAIEQNSNINFSQLLEMIAITYPAIRIRFSTSHPKDMTDDVLFVMAKYNNICKYIHLPVQSGNSRILGIMNRDYTREWYIERIKAIRSIVPDCAISTDIITGFCTETEQEHQDTLSLMESIKFHYAYMFKYSERPNTPAQKKYNDNVDDKIKVKRLEDVISLQQAHSLERNKMSIGKKYAVLVEGISKRSKEHLFGRNSQNTVIIFPKKKHKVGDFVNIFITHCTSATLFGEEKQ